ncbi:S-layer homology domain-containing protein [Faecalimonas umbilicata]|nr:S-layer homology domain-containing protein [Faecalimonas umbilicata]
MREKMKRAISTVLLCAFLVNVFCVNALAADNNKISQELLTVMDGAEDDELIPVWLWKESISDERIVQMLLEEEGIDSADYEQNPEKYAEERKEIVRREYSALNDSFVETYVGKDRKVIYNSRYTSTLVVEATKAEIEAYASLDDVLEISLYEEEIEEPGNDAGGSLDPEISETLRIDYLCKIKEESPDNTYVQSLTEADIIIDYYGTYNGCEAVVMSVAHQTDTTDLRDIQIGRYVFTFDCGSKAERFYVHKDGGFIPVKDAYETGIISEEDVAGIAEAFGSACERKCTYKDVREGEWFYDYVNEMFVKDIMTGLDVDTFGPNEPLARAQFAVILHRMEGMPEVTVVPARKWSDIADNQWYSNAVMWAVEKGIMTGYSHSDYWGTADAITREQMVTVMYRYAKNKGYDVSRTGDVSRFSDAETIQPFAQDAMEWAVGEQILLGKDEGKKLHPQGQTTRAECAAIIQRFTEKYK